MRQAYDYWQDQPGNYLSSARAGGHQVPPARSAKTRRPEPGGAFFDRNPTHAWGEPRAKAVLCGAPPPAPSPEGPQRSEEKAPSLEARLCEFLPGRSSDPEGQAPGGGKLVSHPGRRLPAGRPAALARPARPSSAPPRRRRRDERPVRPSSLLDITLAQRVAVQAPHPRRPASHDGERPPTARPPLGGPAASDLDTTRRHNRAGRRDCPKARGAGLGPAESSVAHRAPGARALRARQ